jgi:formate hydrogenlyase subunit 6/NADH:ubiquinone oxidoreductase subunit I
MPSIVQEVGETFVTLFKGFSVTLRTMFKKTATDSFPDFARVKLIDFAIRVDSQYV